MYQEWMKDYNEIVFSSNKKEDVESNSNKKEESN